MKSFEVLLPEIGDELDQNEEFFILKLGEDENKVKFHDYDKIYSTPGLYEEIFHEKLKCQSPDFIANLLEENFSNDNDLGDHLRILDFGAGNGIVAEKLNSQNTDVIVGVDILEAAKEAALRDRKEIYDDYLVTDLSCPESEVIDKLESYDFNTLVSVAALGFDHIPPEAFINAFNLIENDGLVAFNIRDKFLTKRDESGFRKTFDRLADEFIELKETKTYRHRYSLNGDPINYKAIIAKKVKDIDIQHTSADLARA